MSGNEADSESTMEVDPEATSLKDALWAKASYVHSPPRTPWFTAWSYFSSQRRSEVSTMASQRVQGKMDPADLR